MTYERQSLGVTFSLRKPGRQKRIHLRAHASLARPGWSKWSDWQPFRPKKLIQLRIITVSVLFVLLFSGKLLMVFCFGFFSRRPFWIVLSTTNWSQFCPHDPTCVVSGSGRSVTSSGREWGMKWVRRSHRKESNNQLRCCNTSANCKTFFTRKQPISHFTSVCENFWG